MKKETSKLPRWLYAALVTSIGAVPFVYAMPARADAPPPQVDYTKCPTRAENGRMVMEGKGCVRALPWNPSIQVEFDPSAVGTIAGSSGSPELYLEKGKVRVTSLLGEGKGPITKVRVIGSEESVEVAPGLVSQVEYMEASQEVACISTKGTMKVSTSYSAEKSYPEGQGEVFPLLRPVTTQAGADCSFKRPRRKSRHIPEVWGFGGLLCLVLLRRLRRKT